MQIPSAGFIEIARDELAKLSPDILIDQTRELRNVLGDTQITLVNGYNLALQVARVMLAESPLLAKHGINPSDLL